MYVTKGATKVPLQLRVANLLRLREMMLLILLLFAAAAVCARTGRRAAARILFVPTVIVTLAIGCGVIPAPMLKNLQSAYPDEVSGPWPRRTAIVVLGGGVQKVGSTHALRIPPFIHGRIVKGLELYLQC